MRWGGVLALALSACAGEVIELDGGVDAGATDAGLGVVVALSPPVAPLVLSAAPLPSGDVVFAGGLAGPAGGLLARFDGATVRALDPPPGPALWWVHAFPSGRVIVVGGEGRLLSGRPDALVAEPTGLPELATLYGVFGVSERDLWAVGGSTSPRGPKGIVLRSSGDGRWRRLDDPEIPTDRNLYKVWGRAADEVFVVGDGVALRFDGVRFHRHDFPFADPLLTVHGAPGGPILAVGGRARGIVVRFDGTTWVSEDPGAAPALAAVFVEADGRAWVGGNAGFLQVRRADGTWSPVPTRLGPGAEDKGFHAVLRHQGVTWAVGGRLALGRDGLLATDFAGPAVLDPRGFPAVADAGDEDGGVDGGPDAGRDGGDAGRDGGRDAGRDGGDAGRDGGRDAGRDGGDAGRDGGRDAGRDGGDAGRDGGVLDANDGGDADAEDDAGPSQDAAADAGGEDGGLPGPGEDCPAFACREGLECLPLAQASYMPYCLSTCASPADCADFGEAPCCVQPGPQTFMTYCVPSALLGGVCP